MESPFDEWNIFSIIISVTLGMYLQSYQNVTFAFDKYFKYTIYFSCVWPDDL